MQCRIFPTDLLPPEEIVHGLNDDQAMLAHGRSFLCIYLYIDLCIYLLIYLCVYLCIHRFIFIFIPPGYLNPPYPPSVVDGFIYIFSRPYSSGANPGQTLGYHCLCGLEESDPWSQWNGVWCLSTTRQSRFDWLDCCLINFILLDYIWPYLLIPEP